MKQKEILNGHGFFRKSKAYGLVCGIALGLAFLGGQVSADEVTAPTTETATTVTVAPTESTTSDAEAATSSIANTVETPVEALHPEVTEQTQEVPVDNAAVDTAVTNAQEAGVSVTQGETQDYGVATTPEELANAQAAIAKDQDTQVKNLEEVTKQQEAINTAYEEAKTAVDANNAFVNDTLKTYDGDDHLGQITVTENTATATDGSASANQDAKALAEETLQANQKALSDYLKAVDDYQATKTQLGISEVAIAQAKQQLDQARQTVLALADTTTGFDRDYFTLTGPTTVTVKPQYVSYQGLTGDALRQAIATNQALYEAAVAHALEVAKQSQTHLEQAIQDYNNKSYMVVTKTSEDSGVLWTSNTTVEAGNGAEKVSGGRYVDANLGFNGESIEAAAQFAISGILAGSGAVENTDASFNNIFYIGNGGTLVIKNTSNGDVTVTFDGIDSSTSANYVAVWGDDGGGIAWGLFNLYAGSGSSGSSVESGGAGTGSTSGNMVGLVRAYNFTITTTGKVADFTFNDIDNRQVVQFTGNSLDNSQVHTGANISTTGTGQYSAGEGDVSQGSVGVLGSNGIHVAYDESGVRTITGRHTTYSTTNGIQGTASIVAGIFGEESIREHEEITYQPIEVSIQLETVGTPEDVILEEPDLALVTLSVPTKQTLAAEYHDYQLQEYVAPKTPTPETPQPTQEVLVVQASVLPMTGDETTPLNIIASLFGVLMFVLGIFGIRKRNENKED